MDDSFFARHAQRPLGGRYILESAIGHGAAATVYRANDLKHQRTVAVKVLHPQLSAAIGAERFAREIALLASLQHPHILPLHDSGEEEGALYFVTPLVSGETLRTRLTRERQLPIADAIRIGREIADALASAHEREIIHRDIKPENILLSGGHAMLADFGIALAVPHDAGRRITDSGLAVGTPSYMSPEQASADEVDGRSDLYSLGCVMYEMICGHPPFVGATPQIILAKRFKETPQDLRKLRESVSPGLERIVRTALARVPADRFDNAKAMREALQREESVATIAPRQAHPSRRHWFAAGAAATIVLGALVAMRLRAPDAHVDRALHMVTPCLSRGASAATSAALTPENCEALLYDAFGRWRDLRLVDAFRVHDAQAQLGRPAGGIDDGLRLARRMGAGVLALGEITPAADSVTVRAALYDALSGESIYSHSVRVAPDMANASVKFAELVDSLVLRGGAGDAPPMARTGTRSLEAWRAYAHGERSLRGWDLDAAATGFREAMKHDERFAAPALRLAQVTQWRGEAPPAWREAVTHALRHGDQLSRRDLALANALLAMADTRYPDACHQYELLLRRDSLDFPALFGLAECHANDPIVERNPASPSGWSFRGSHHRAIESYRRALELIPSFHIATRGLALSRLPRLLQVSGPVLRAGIAPGRDTVRFYGAMALDRDTLAFVPYPVREFGEAARPSTTPTTGPALQRNRRILRDVTTSWVRAFPNSPHAHEALGMLLETVGELRGNDEEHSAALAFQRARELSAARADQVRLEMARLRLLLKGARYGEARRLADSLLRSTTDPTPVEADWLKGAAALTGRVAETARLLERSASEASVRTTDARRVEVPSSVLGPARALLGYASFGVPADSVRALHRRTEELVRQWVEPSQRPAVRNALLTLPVLLAFPTLGTDPVDYAGVRDDYLVSLRQRLVRGDTAGIQEQFTRLAGARLALRPGDVSIDAAFAEAQILLAIGDTVATVATLDGSLGAIPGMDDRVLRVVPMTVALVRAMALRAELAARQGDRATARRWASAVVDLWGGADAALAPLVSHLRAVGGA
ncbi:MAG TPA: serine/threonine-protein kinase [Gemmatimonadaceae bacterium]|nr:serine/threonine-protein kinase [Gemmatimonadaceae bacterium]